MIAQAADFQVSDELRDTMRQWRSRFAVFGAAGLLATVAGLFLVSPNQFYRSWLWSHLFVLGLSAGSLAWLMVQYLTGGAWGVIIRRPAEAAARTLPLVVLLFIPIFIGIRNLYPWSHSDIMMADAVLRQKRLYLNLPFFAIRALLYLGGWCFLSWFMNRWSAIEDREGGLTPRRKMGALSGPGLIFMGLTITFMATDWVLSINPRWYSTMYGLLMIAGYALSSMAFLIAVMVFLAARKPMADVLTPRHLHDLGKLMFMLVMLWAYFAFSQFLIIWAGNLPEEIPWYLVRLRSGWQYMALAIVIGHFALPFALLLSRDLKRNFKLLRNIALFVLLMRAIDTYWDVAPEFRKGSFSPSWMDLSALLGLGGIWLAYFLGQLEKRPLLPLHDPHLSEALEHGRE
ncbi:MAG TPA: hypothetical protein VIN93_02785 [Bryobacteraceae bacterium]